MTPALWTPAYVALGSNLDDPALQVRRAFAELRQLTSSRLIAHSSLYQSAPLGPQDQPAFVNAMVGLLTQLSALDLLAQLQAIERRMGRETPILRWGPRLIDLDVVMYGDMRSDTSELQLPHPGLMQRNFVAAPLAEIAPHLILPQGLTAAMLARQLGLEGLQRLRDDVSA